MIERTLVLHCMIGVTGLYPLLEMCALILRMEWKISNAQMVQR